MSYKIKVLKDVTNGYEITVVNDRGYELTFLDVIKLMTTQPVEWHRVFCGFIIAAAYKMHVEGVFWEWPKLTPQMLRTPTRFRSVVLGTHDFKGIVYDAGAFGITPRAGEIVTKTKNRSGDALLVIPDLRANVDYGHLWSFAKNADVGSPMVALYWKQVGLTISEETELNGARGTWVSTSGLGIAWLHLRVSSIAKYYRHSDYSGR